jgi:hypothetical protein
MLAAPTAPRSTGPNAASPGGADRLIPFDRVEQGEPVRAEPLIQFDRVERFECQRLRSVDCGRVERGALAARLELGQPRLDLDRVLVVVERRELLLE